MFKTRPYPMNNLGFAKRGDICKLCDRKFFVKEMIMDSIIQIEQNQQQLTNVQKDLSQKQKELKLVDTDIEDQKKYSDFELDKVREINMVYLRT